MLCHPSVIICDKPPRALSTLLYNHCQASSNEFVIRDLRSVARISSCCLTKCMNAKRRIAINDPHKRIERIRAQTALPGVDNAGARGGGRGNAGTIGNLLISGGILPNKRKGRRSEEHTSELQSRGLIS